jgi:hypothetical protein
VNQQLPQARTDLVEVRRHIEHIFTALLRVPHEALFNDTGMRGSESMATSTLQTGNSRWKADTEQFLLKVYNAIYKSADIRFARSQGVDRSQHRVRIELPSMIMPRDILLLYDRGIMPPEMTRTMLERHYGVAEGSFQTPPPPLATVEVKELPKDHDRKPYQAPDALKQEHQMVLEAEAEAEAKAEEKKKAKEAKSQQKKKRPKPSSSTSSKSKSESKSKPKTKASDKSKPKSKPKSKRESTSSPKSKPKDKDESKDDKSDTPKTKSKSDSDSKPKQKKKRTAKKKKNAGSGSDSDDDSSSSSSSSDSDSDSDSSSDSDSEPRKKKPKKSS